MAKRFIADSPASMFHGTLTPQNIIQISPAANRCWYTKVDWRKHDSWMNGGSHLEEGIPYANIVWEAIGLRNRAKCPDDVPAWARKIRSHQQLSLEYGLIFVTNCANAASKYGDVRSVNIYQDSIVDVIEDPHVRTHDGWILILKAGTSLMTKKA